MHDGIKGYLNAIECVNKLFQENKKIIIISNSSKRQIPTFAKLPNLGFNPNHFDNIMTSGEMIWQSLKNITQEKVKNLGKKYYEISNNLSKLNNNFLNDLSYFEPVDDFENSDFILGCTPFKDMEVLDFYPMLNFAITKKIPFICANPDYVSYDMRKKKTTYCMGTIAELYKNMGGKVFHLGKPKTEIYIKALNKLINIKKSRILAVGDSIHHDIKGAKNFEIDSLLITSKGVHQADFDKKKPIWDSNRNTIKKIGINPTFICSEFIF
jgi:HAD superfamily hydrolase (TIGR01459 family)